MSERMPKASSDHPALEPLFSDDFMNLMATEIAPQYPEVTPTTMTRRKLGKQATIGEVKQLEGSTPHTPVELARKLRMDAISEEGEDVYQKVSEAYGDLGGGLQREYILSPDSLLRTTKLCATLETYQDWYKEFDDFARSGVFEAGNAYRNMDNSQRHAYFLHLFDIIDIATNRIGLIGREKNPSASPTIQEIYGKKTDEELSGYAANLAELRSHAYETQVVRAMFSELDVNVNERGVPYMPTWLLQKIRKQVQASKGRTRGERRQVRFMGKGMTYKSSRKTTS